MKRILTILPIMLLAACSQQEETSLVYDTAGTERRTLEVAVSSAGIVEPLATVEVKSKASGEVLDVQVETGDLVEEGTLMVRIDPRIVRNRLAQSDAELKAAISRREIATTQKKRVESLVSNGTLTQSDLEQATLDLANAVAQVVTANVAVENARIAVDDTDIRAPIGGTIIFKPVEIGQVISSPTQDFAGGTLLMQMADLSAVQIRSLVDETDIGKIQPGMQVSVSVAAYPNQPFPGEVVKIEPQAVVDQNVTMFAVLVSIQNPDGLLLPGMNAEVEISIARAADAMTIPVMALRTRRDLESTALILGRSVDDISAELGGGEGRPAGGSRPQPGQRGGRPDGGQTADYRFGGEFWVVLDTPGREIRKVTTGVTDLDNVEVISGLDENDRVLVLPSSHLLETQQDLQNFINRRMRGVPGIG
ncbi:MAG: efflux RND transporter periplasmic adaptor subunit [Gammaproteobacteria bacterium]|jgi:HlyD family secretion protein|nr:efflux RND transporter periplasmic adaptor subunit [Gammaproteobacteria bacterium]